MPVAKDKVKVEVEPKKDPYVPEGVENQSVYLTALDALKGYDSDSPLPFKELAQKISSKAEDAPKTYLIYRDVNLAGQDPLSPIRSRKGRSGGFFLVEDAKLVVDDSVPTKAELKKEKTLEKHIWPLVAHWLRETKRIPNVSHEVASFKSRGSWSNPDVVGLHPFEELGFFDVEVTTIEVKPSLKQWRYYFFEAVSHKRISEQVYFVFRSDNDDLNEVEELKRYSEKYGVGLVELQLDDQQYASLANWKTLTDDDLTNLLERMVELMPAPVEPLSIRSKISFLRQMKIKSKSDIYRFGELKNR